MEGMLRKVEKSIWIVKSRWKKHGLKDEVLATWMWTGIGAQLAHKGSMNPEKKITPGQCNMLESKRRQSINIHTKHELLFFYLSHKTWYLQWTHEGYLTFSTIDSPKISWHAHILNSVNSHSKYGMHLTLYPSLNLTQCSTLNSQLTDSLSLVNSTRGINYNF